ncbi:helix-turn-helix domain-containing protein [Streptomyces sp. NPDC001657]|uniref:TetR/AcrR family transcriptional regulator n=1 Tax=Streptomyces sp. NPDC001657 TaxID=3154522 RepID=UPI003331337C
MTSRPGPAPQRSHARSNRARILATAREELSRNPEANLEEIARAAGVVRRTLYGHFPNRQALIAALAEEAAQSLEEAFTSVRQSDAAPATALARKTLAVRAVGDRYRMLISLGRRDLGEEGIRAALAPVRAEATSILEHGQREGVFSDHLPAPILAQALESLTLTLIEAQDPSAWHDPTGDATALAVLIAAGLTPAAARTCLRSARTELDNSSGPAD